MTLDRLKKAIDEGNEIFFDYNGQRCGILVEVENSIFTFTIFYGDDEAECDSFDKAVNSKFFLEKSIADLLNVVEFDFY